MKNSIVILVALAISVWAQAQDSAQEPDESVMACPMMGMTSPMQEGGGGRKMMGRMAGMFSLSREEIARYSPNTTKLSNFPKHKSSKSPSESRHLKTKRPKSR